MFFKRAITKSTNTYSQAVEALRDEIDTADAIIIGAGSGFPAAAGLAYLYSSVEAFIVLRLLWHSAK